LVESWPRIRASKRLWYPREEASICLASVRGRGRGFRSYIDTFHATRDAGLIELAAEPPLFPPLRRSKLLKLELLCLAILSHPDELVYKH
jgi:hypothetical protein